MIRTHIPGWHRPRREGIRAMATNLCESEIGGGATSSPCERSKKGKLTIKCDQLWSFVDRKDNKQWMWLALDANTRADCWSVYWSTG